jgi:hypothetical protein
MNGAWRTFYSESTFYSNKYVDFYDDNEDLRKTYLQNYFTPYISKYSGGFPLVDSIIIPKPCAYKSSNLTSVSYYRGQNTYKYDVSKQNRQGTVITQMSADSQLVFQNGTNASNIAVYDQSKYSVMIQTNDEIAVGLQKLIIRDCDYLDRLMELSLYVEVLANTPPDFVETVTQIFTMAVNETVIYKLPAW